jgi:ceramide glucosyltransferase
MDDMSELLLGCHEQDRQRLQMFMCELRHRYPKAALKVVVHPGPNSCANPKIAWMRILAPSATGELWLWSDADIQAPPGTIQSLRADLGVAVGGMVTSPYVIKGGRKAAELLDMLFVNVEFYPGVVLMSRLNMLSFGFGSAMLFEANVFHRRVDWDCLGRCLADDYELGRQLAPVRLGSMRLTTLPAADQWSGAIRHYLRWQKTIRWCRPGAYAAQLVVLPILGWLAWIASNPSALTGWIGLAGVMAMDTIAALTVSKALRSPIGRGGFLAIPLWSLGRGLSWIACWLPLPIVWRERKWWSANQQGKSCARVLTPRRETGPNYSSPT